MLPSKEGQVKIWLLRQIVSN